MTDKLVEQETRRWLYCCACGAPVKGSSDCNCQYFVISREEFLGYTKALASSSVPEQDSWQPIGIAGAREALEKIGALVEEHAYSGFVGDRRRTDSDVLEEVYQIAGRALPSSVTEADELLGSPPPAVSGLQDSHAGRCEVGPDDPLYQALRPSKEAMEEMERMETARKLGAARSGDFIVGSAPQDRGTSQEDGR